MVEIFVPQPPFLTVASCVLRTEDFAPPPVRTASLKLLSLSHCPPYATAAERCYAAAGEPLVAAAEEPPGWCGRIFAAQSPAAGAAAAPMRKKNKENREGECEREGGRVRERGRERERARMSGSKLAAK